MEIGNAALTVIASIAMIVTFVIAFLPVIPGPLVLWGVALVYGILSGFDLLTPPAMIGITALMIAGSTSDFWLPLLGVKGSGASCSAVAGTLIGGLIGTFAIPIPIVGTLIGSMAGALLLEVLRLGSLSRALPAAHFALRTFVVGMAVEIVVNLMIIAVFFAVVLG